MLPSPRGKTCNLISNCIMSEHYIAEKDKLKMHETEANSASTSCILIFNKEKFCQVL